MVSGTQIYKKYRQQSIAIIIIAIIVSLLVGYFSANIVGNIAQDDLRSKAQETISIQVETLTEQLDKYRLLLATLARRSDISEQETTKHGVLFKRITAVERQIIANELVAQSSRLKATYEALGISRKSLHEKMQKHNFSGKDFKKKI